MRHAVVRIRAVARIATVAVFALVLTRPSVEIKMEASVKIEVTVPAQLLPESAFCRGLPDEERSGDKRRGQERGEAGGARVPH